MLVGGVFTWQFFKQAVCFRGMTEQEAGFSRAGVFGSCVFGGMFLDSKAQRKDEEMLTENCFLSFHVMIVHLDVFLGAPKHSKVKRISHEYHYAHHLDSFDIFHAWKKITY